MTTLTGDDRRTQAELRRLAAERRAELCPRCGDRGPSPCGWCALRRERIAALAHRGMAPVAIAAAVGLPAWRVRDILDERRDAAPGVGGDWARNADLLRPELGDRLVELILAGPPRRPPRHPAVLRWHAGVSRLLAARGWHPRAVRLVLAGTHIPNAPLRARVTAYRAAHPSVSADVLARRAGLRCGTYFDRLLGARPTARATRRGRTYGGRRMTTIAVEPAARIARAIELAPRDVPGL